MALSLPTVRKPSTSTTATPIASPKPAPPAKPDDLLARAERIAEEARQTADRLAAERSGLEATHAALGRGVEAIRRQLGPLQAERDRLRALLADAAALGSVAVTVFDLPPDATERAALLENRIATLSGERDRLSAERATMEQTIRGLLGQEAEQRKLAKDARSAALQELAAAVRSLAGIPWGQIAEVVLMAQRLNAEYELLAANAPVKPITFEELLGGLSVARQIMALPGHVPPHLIAALRAGQPAPDTDADECRAFLAAIQARDAASDARVIQQRG